MFFIPSRIARTCSSNYFRFNTGGARPNALRPVRTMRHPLLALCGRGCGRLSHTLYDTWRYRTSSDDLKFSYPLNSGKVPLPYAHFRRPPFICAAPFIATITRSTSAISFLPRAYFTSPNALTPPHRPPTCPSEYGSSSCRRSPPHPFQSPFTVPFVSSTANPLAGDLHSGPHFFSRPTHTFPTPSLFSHPVLSQSSYLSQSLHKNDARSHHRRRRQDRPQAPDCLGYEARRHVHQDSGQACTCSAA